MSIAQERHAGNLSIPVTFQFRNKTLLPAKYLHIFIKVQRDRIQALLRKEIPAAESKSVDKSWER